MVNPFWEFERFVFARFNGSLKWEPTVANYVTMIRGRIAYFFMPLLYLLSLNLDDSLIAHWCAIGSFLALLVACAGDLVDGWAARRWGMSEWGRIADLISDGAIVFFGLLVVISDHGGRIDFVFEWICLTTAGILVLLKRVRDLDMSTPTLAKGKQFLAALSTACLFFPIAARAVIGLGYHEVFGVSLQYLSSLAGSLGSWSLLLVTPIAILTVVQYGKMERKKTKP